MVIYFGIYSTNIFKKLGTCIKKLVRMNLFDRWMMSGYVQNSPVRLSTVVIFKVHWWGPPTPHMSWMSAQEGQTGAQRQMEAAYGHYRQGGNLYVTNL